MIVAERLREAINSMPIEYDNKAITISLSFGISLLKSNRNINKIELIKEADRALYQAKRAGKNICKCYNTAK